jgi:hypothetical protein
VTSKKEDGAPPPINVLQRGTSVYSELSLVGISNLLNGKPFACNLLNKLCSYDMIYVTITITSDYKLWNQYLCEMIISTKAKLIVIFVAEICY